MKKRLTFFCLLISFALSAQLEKPQQIKSKMGRLEYSVNYIGKPIAKQMKVTIDSLFLAIDNSLSTRVPTSKTNLFNSHGAVQSDALFEDIFHRSYAVYANTKGAYNPSDYAYEKYWSTHNYMQANKSDSNQIDSIYKYNILSGFIEYDSSAYDGAQNYHIISTEDFPFLIGFEDVLVGYKADALKLLLNTYQGCFSFNFEIKEKGFTHKSGIIIHYDQAFPNEFRFVGHHDYGFDNHGHMFKIQSQLSFQLKSHLAMEGACYLSALHKTQLNNNYNYWKELILSP